MLGPLADYIRSKGGTIPNGAKIVSVEVDAEGNSVGLCVQRGDPTSERRTPERSTPEHSAPELITADDYVLALPIHNLKRLIPQSWMQHDYFRGLLQIDSVPVVSVHLWADRQISYMDNILFSPDGVIPVYAEMANTTPEYRTNGNATRASRKSRFQFVVAPPDSLLKQVDATISGQGWH